MSQEKTTDSYGDLLRYCDPSFDTDFDKLITSGHLTWRPWIGSNWRNAERRILVVGESHYAAKPDDENVEAKIQEWQADSNGTREIVYEVGVEDWYSSRFFGNLHRALFGMDIHGEKRSALWQNLAFYNFIQRPMRNPEERPSPDEFFGGWRHFVELLKILRPQMVVFVGVSAAKFFDGAMSALGIEHTIAFDDYRNGAFPCKFSLTYDGVTSTMVAIRHTSQYFSWETWQDYLAKAMPEDIALLRKVISIFDGGENEATQTPQENDTVREPMETSLDDIRLEGLPTWLQHKPVVACDYQELNAALGNFDYHDPRFISVGHAQYDPNAVSVKMFRWADSGRWSRQSEEVPIQRLPYMMAMLLAAISKVQSSDAEDCGMNEQVVAPQDMDLLRDQIHEFAMPLKDGLSRVKDLLNRIDINAL